MNDPKLGRGNEISLSEYCRRKAAVALTQRENKEYKKPRSELKSRSAI
jgi:hypothetical protein